MSANSIFDIEFHRLPGSIGMLAAESPGMDRSIRLRRGSEEVTDHSNLLDVIQSQTVVKVTSISVWVVTPGSVALGRGRRSAKLFP